MAKIRPIKYDSNEQEGYLFFCSGCGIPHMVDTKGSGAIWSWNGSIESPTFSPSILVRMPWGNPPQDVRCHSYVREGRIEYLSDCTHHLAGKTIDLPDVDTFFNEPKEGA